jgi:hypothetical protein
MRFAEGTLRKAEMSLSPQHDNLDSMINFKAEYRKGGEIYGKHNARHEPFLSAHACGSRLERCKDRRMEVICVEHMVPAWMD